MRAQALSVKERTYVERSQALGSGSWHMITRHILPNVFPVLFSNMVLTVSLSILSETTLSILGLGDPNSISWGVMLGEAFEEGALTAGIWWWTDPARRLSRARDPVVHDVRLRVGRDLESEVARAMTVLSLRDLRITYKSKGGGVPAVRGVDLEVGTGEVLGLAGESGCGKSTIAAAVLRLLPAGTKVEGSILLDGQDILGLSLGKLRAARWTGASIIFQGAQHSLNPVRRVGDQIGEAIVVHGQAGEREARVQVGALLEQVGLPPRRQDDYPHELSGGQKQRVMIAMALACSPSLVIADEPTTALDVMVQAQVLRLLKQLQRDLGLSMVFITHDLSVLVEVSDRLAIMYAGRIVEEGPAERLFHEPKHPYTEALAAAFPEIGDVRFRGKPSGLGGDPPDPEHIPPGCSFHPRCPYRFDDCDKVDPPLFDVGPGRRSACLLRRPVAATTAEAPG